MSFSGSLIQNAIYIAQQPPEWPISAADWERAAEEKLEPGAFGYIAGGAGAEETMRANLDAFRSWRIRPRMLTGNVSRDLSVDVLGLQLGRAVSARTARRPLDRARGGRGGGRRRPPRRRACRSCSRALRRIRSRRSPRRMRRAGSSSTGSRIARSARASSSGPRTRATARSSSRSTR